MMPKASIERMENGGGSLFKLGNPCLVRHSLNRPIIPSTTLVPHIRSLARCTLHAGPPRDLPQGTTIA